MKYIIKSYSKQGKKVEGKKERKKVLGYVWFLKSSKKEKKKLKKILFSYLIVQWKKNYNYNKLRIYIF